MRSSSRSSDLHHRRRSARRLQASRDAFEASYETVDPEFDSVDVAEVVRMLVSPAGDKDGASC